MFSHPEDNEHLLHQLLNDVNEGGLGSVHRFLAKGSLEIAEILMNVTLTRKLTSGVGLGPPGPEAFGVLTK